MHLLIEKIKCPWGFGDKTRHNCQMCSYCNLEDCPTGAYFVRNRENDRPVFEHWLIK